MITVDQFRQRVTALWDSQKRMAAARKWKSGRRAGQVKTPAAIIQFTKRDLEKWLWEDIGLSAALCPYCQGPMDILSLTLDHVVPRSLGGQFRLDNMQPICVDCNHRKGDMTHEGFTSLIDFARSILTPYDQGILLKRLADANAGSASRFFRDKKNQQPQPANLPLPKPAQQAELDWF